MEFNELELVVKSTKNKEILSEENKNEILDVNRIYCCLDKH